MSFAAGREARGIAEFKGREIVLESWVSTLGWIASGHKWALRE